MASLRTPLCDLLGIEYPIVLAGMATGTGKQSIAPTPTELVAAVSNAGGLGVMADDGMAALYGNLIMRGLIAVTPGWFV